MKKILVFAIFMAMTISSFSQKKPLDHSVYDNWKSVAGFSVTDDSRFTMFNVNAQEGDGYLVIHNLLTGEQKSIPRATTQKFTSDGKYVAFVIKPKFDETKAAKIKKVKPDMMPKDSLGIYNTISKDLKKFPFLKGYKIGKYAKDFLAFQTTPPADTAKSKKPVKKDKDEGTDLFLYQFSTNRLDTLKFVSDYDFSNGGDTLFFVTRPNLKDSVNKAGLYLYIPKTKSLTKLYGYNLKQSVKLPVVSEDNSTLVFYAKLDTTKKKKDKAISVLKYKAGYPEAKVILDSTASGLSKGWQISDNRSLDFNKAGTRLFFGISKIIPEKDTTLYDADLAKLDIWHYSEPYIQPMQLINLSRELKKTYLSKIELDGESGMVQLATDEYETPLVAGDWSADWAYSASNSNYKIESQWSANPRRDIYIIDVNTGNSKIILKDVYVSNVNASPDANFLTWYNNADYQWYSYEVSSGNTACLTKNLSISFTDELNDSPAMASSYGSAGWAEGDKWFYVYDRFDVWQIDPKGIANPVNITEGTGRKENKAFRVFRPDDNMMSRFRGDAPEAIKSNEIIYFSALDNITKDNGYYAKDFSKKKPVLQKLVLEPFTFASFTKAKKGSVITFVKHNFTNSPDVWVTKDNFKTQSKITDINPQQRDYNWGTSELVKWKSANGTDLEGLLFKPENFDPAKKYPMIAYFYERNSDFLNVYRAPAPSRSTINITYFTSNGYIVFIPDIVYEIGHPGKSAIDCIVPGVKMLCENPWVDSENVAIQGQSWGGYQVAYMVTKPETFKWKAAGAGAPVANMTSAYGGIRWGTGMVRQFQYEHTQSRLGKTLWDGFDLYIENSPLFFANKVETPILIMHNDADDAVPWYQGIEYFTALRRLGKPAWLLQYNKETHNLTSRVNAKDLSIRLSQFFDHYLKGAPMPVWMKSGVPATLKGIDWGYELVKE